MKFPSIFYLKNQAVISLKRFPFTLSAAFIGVIIAIYSVDQEENLNNILPYVNSMLISTIGIPLFFCIKIFSEKQDLSSRSLNTIRTGGVILLLLIFFTMPNLNDGSAIAIPYIRYAVYNICVHLSVAFVPFIRAGEINGFWQYNKILFVRILSSALYSGVLFIGLVLAIVALNQLFGVEINDSIYLKLFIIIAGIFNTWFFLSGIPAELAVLENDKNYPKALRIFAQYVLVSLLVVYLLILYAYIAKIIYLWDWPEGIVSYMIMWVAVVGILTLLLIHPYRHEKGGGWIPVFGKAYFIILVPLIVVLFMAIGIRVNDYGITINRYVLITLGVWLTLITVYFIIGRTSIKFIPISLAIIALVISFGPWSMFSVSERNQVNRLTKILVNNGFLENGKLANEVHWNSIESEDNKLVFENNGIIRLSLNDSLHNEVKSILDYLNDFHGLNRLDEWYEQELSSKILAFNTDKTQIEKINRAEVYMEVLGLEYKTIDMISSGKYMNYYVNKLTESIDILGYQHFVEINFYANNKSNLTINKFDIDSIQYTLSLKEQQLIVYNGNADSMFFDFTPIFQLKGGRDNEYTHDELTIMENGKVFNGKLVLKSLNAEREGEKIEIRSWNGYILFGSSTY